MVALPISPKIESLYGLGKQAAKCPSYIRDLLETYKPARSYDHREGTC